MTGTARNVFAELRADSLANDGIDRIAEIEHITSPVLLVRGDPDTGSLVHPDDAVSFAERLPDARVAFIPEAGHALHRERTTEFLAIAIPFLEDCANRSAPGGIE
jgi:pimeloyl-ACP methyl ester carboxylesterase